MMTLPLLALLAVAGSKVVSPQTIGLPIPCERLLADEDAAAAAVRKTADDYDKLAARARYLAAAFVANKRPSAKLRQEAANFHAAEAVLEIDGSEKPKALARARRRVAEAGCQRPAPQDTP